MEEIEEYMIDETLHDCNRLLSKMTEVTSTLKALSFEKERSESLHTNLSLHLSNSSMDNNNLSPPDLSSLSLSGRETQVINPPPPTPIPVDTDTFPLKYEDWELWRLGSKQHQPQHQQNPYHQPSHNNNQYPDDHDNHDPHLSNASFTYPNEGGTENLEDLMGRMKVIENEMQKLNSLQEHPNPTENELITALSGTMSTLQVNNHNNNNNGNNLFNHSNNTRDYNHEQTSSRSPEENILYNMQNSNTNEAMTTSLEKHMNFANKVDRTVESRKHVLQWFTELKDSFAEHIPPDMTVESIQNEAARFDDNRNEYHYDKFFQEPIEEVQQQTVERVGQDQMEYENQTNSFTNETKYPNEEALIQECERIGAQQQSLLHKLNDLVISKQPYYLMPLPTSTDQQHYNQYNQYN